MVVAGVVLAATVAGGWQVVGGGLAAVGGALLSWSTATVRTTEQAQKVLKPNLETISRHLAAASGQISRAVQAVNLGNVEATMAIGLISQTTSLLYGLVNDIQVMAGSEFSSENLIATVDGCEELAVSLEKKLSMLSQPINPAEGEESIRAMRGELETLRLQLQSAKRDIGPPSGRPSWKT